MANGIRIPAVAGRFYPEDKVELNNTLSMLFKNTEGEKSTSKLKALIVPHAGYVYSGKTAAKGLSKIDAQQNEHYLIIGPSHYVAFKGISGSSLTYWETPLGDVEQIVSKSFVFNDNAHQFEHSIEVELPFLQYLHEYSNFMITSLLTGFNVDVSKSVDMIMKEFPDSILIISTDLSHFLSQEEAQQIDKNTIDAILSLDVGYFEAKDNVACGKSGIEILIELAKRSNLKLELIDYRTSYDASGDLSSVVGYAAIGFYVK